MTSERLTMSTESGYGVRSLRDLRKSLEKYVKTLGPEWPDMELVSPS
jgi:hypothetical protein